MAPIGCMDGAKIPQRATSLATLPISPRPDDRSRLSPTPLDVTRGNIRSPEKSFSAAPEPRQDRHLPKMIAVLRADVHTRYGGVGEVTHASVDPPTRRRSSRGGQAHEQTRIMIRFSLAREQREHIPRSVASAANTPAAGWQSPRCSTTSLMGTPATTVGRRPAHHQGLMTS